MHVMLIMYDLFMLARYTLPIRALFTTLYSMYIACMASSEVSPHAYSYYYYSVAPSLKFAACMEGPWNISFYLRVWDIVNYLLK